MLAHGITLVDLDTFAARAKGHKLKRDFFQKRIVANPDGHIKAFASETIEAVKVLIAYSDVVIVQAGVMHEHVRCLRLLGTMGDILFKPADINQNVRVLEQTAEEHHELSVRLYNTIPKTHFLRHVVDCILRFGLVMNCFSSERTHHDSKSIAKHCFNNCTKTLLDRSNFHFAYDLLNCDTLFEEIYMMRPVECDVLANHVGPNTEVLAATEVMSHIGHIKKGDYVHLCLPGVPAPTLGRVLVFLELKPAFGNPGIDHLVLYQPHRGLGCRQWAEASPTHCAHVRNVLRRDIVYVAEGSPVIVHASL